jgi:glycosyltransferase involved in cell wall biosynthesis
MRILHVTPTYFPASYWGGPIFSVYGINNSLAAMPDVQLKVLTTDSAGPKRDDRLKIHKLDFDVLYLNYTVCFTRRIAGASASLELLLKLPAMIHWSDVVHLTATYSFPTIPTLLLCRIWKKPLVWSPRGALLDDQKLGKPKRRNLKYLWTTVCKAIVQPNWTTLHVTSEEEKAASISRIPNTNAVLIRNGVEAVQKLPKREYLPEGRMRLLFIGRIHPKKGVENLLDAITQLNDPSITLSICGDGEVQYVTSLQQYAEKLGLRDGVVNFVGRVDGDLKTNAFLSADVCVFPSYSENFAMVVAESLAHGVPVIVSRETPWKTVEEKQCGLWVDNTSESLVRAIKSIRHMRLAEMGQRGWEWMKEEFSWQSIGEEMLGIYKSAIRINGNRGGA